ncbi:hypothetical protein GQ43DRAFT_436472 [Delitschia confertaspora ATCC 74209]|uniref:Ino eighty subunit 1 n=1 Tax=Delitschia confertaspora ATCC 74209 TaxID=1513339 RepID=A0A9P4MXE7_9PLEO|nr:hypothetical protein GQ43DRAFT_436472 [Delitschia confertaspora ATCC 74209]
MDPSTTSAAPPSAPRSDEPDSRQSLRHILAEDPVMEDSRPSVPQINTTEPVEDTEAAQDEPAPKSATESKLSAETTMYTATTTTTRRNANGSVSSVYSGNKIRHLKKEDGIPLWRKDIQYDFLRYVFEDDKKVFHKVSDGTGGHTFADIYLDAMAKSSKCSKILKDKLLTERPAAINMAMVCLLVNVGRMNTTLNFFPEMRAQLRTYHSIPSLQARQDPNAYKQLQDAPRLKSILKGATEDEEQPSTIEDIKAHAIPRTNPVNLIFVLSQYAPKISELHFFPPRDFFDLVMRPSLSSRSRATAFLWLMWWYLESDFSAEAALNNPYGKGQQGTEGDATNGMPIKCPPFEFLGPDREELENVDTDEEVMFGEIKRKERLAILQSDMAPVVTGPKRTNKKAFNQNPVFSVVHEDGASNSGRERQSPSHGSVRGRGGKFAKSIIADYNSDTDRTRSVSPPNSMYGTGKKSTPNMRINTLLNEDVPAVTPVPASKGPGRGNWSRNRNGAARSFKSKFDGAAAQDGTSPSTNAPASGAHGPHGFYLPLNGSDPAHKRTRPLTQHQLAVEQYRRRRVDVILDRGLRQEYKAAKKRLRRDGAIMRAWVRCKTIPDGYDTDEECTSQAQQNPDYVEPNSRNRTPPPVFAGLVPTEYSGEPPDHGGEAYYRAKMFNRVLRRLDRWEGGKVAVKKKREEQGENLVWMGENGQRQDEEGGNSEQDEDQEMEDMDDALRRDADMESDEENGYEGDKMQVDVKM